MNKRNYDKQLIDAIMAKLIPSLRRAVLVAARRVSSTDLELEDGLLSANQPQSVLDSEGMARQRIRREVSRCLECYHGLYLQLTPHFVADVAKHIAKRRDYLDQMCRLPPVAKKKREPKRMPKYIPLVAVRAIQARKKVKEWQRKQKLAATKLKEYRRKEAYYKKKGLL